MCISSSVGAHKAKNHLDDVKTVQILLNLNLGKLVPLAPLKEDGAVSPHRSATIGAIEEFQRRVVGMAEPDGRVDPHGRTLKELHDGMPPGFSDEKLRGIMIDASAKIIDAYFPLLSASMQRYGITTPLQKAHFLAQVAHESGEFRFTEEIASGAAYEGRADLGNTQPGDGKRFKGRGLIQITGRSNYTAYGKFRGTDFTSDADAKQLSTNPSLAVDVSCWFWKTHGLNTLADADNLLSITKRINGGTNGLADRKTKLARAKFFLVR